MKEPGLKLENMENGQKNYLVSRLAVWYQLYQKSRLKDQPELMTFE